jgi:hypothetical protein
MQMRTFLALPKKCSPKPRWEQFLSAVPSQATIPGGNRTHIEGLGNLGATIQLKQIKIFARDQKMWPRHADRIEFADSEEAPSVGLSQTCSAQPQPTR